MSPERRSVYQTLSACLFPVLLCLAGCDGGLFDRNDRRPDPLLSAPRRSGDDRRPNSYTSYPGDDRTPAGLAGSRSGDGVSGLGIRERNVDDNRDRDRNTQPSGWTGNDSGSGGARLSTPTANSRPGDNPSRSSPAPAPGGPAPRIRSFEEAQQYLMAHGVRWQRLEQRDGEWAFECSVPSRAGGGTMRTYEAHDKYGLIAIQKVLDNIARDQTR